MLYWLHSLNTYWSPLNVFQYITFRMGGAFLTALFIMLIFGAAFIALSASKPMSMAKPGRH